MKSLRTFSRMKAMQETNRISILRVFFHQSPLSRGDIAEATGLSPPTISRIVKELLQEKLVIEVGKVGLTHGRSRDLLQLDFERLYFLGIELTEKAIDAVVCNLHGEVKLNLTETISAKEPAAVAKKLELVVERAHQLHEGFRGLLGIGLSISGLVSEDQQTILYSQTLQWENVHVKQLLPEQERKQRPVIVENDANAAVLGERWLGGVSESANLVYIAVESTGVGASIFENGRLIRGSHGIAGEISHLPVMADGKPCSCGHAGCLETYISLERLQREYEAAGNTSQNLLQAYRAGESMAVHMTAQAAEALSRAILTIMYLVNPDLVIIGSHWIEAGEDFLHLIRRYVADHFVLRATHIPDIAFSNLHPHAGVMGAVGLVIDEFFRYDSNTS